MREVNKNLKQICINYDAHFIENSNVNKSGLNNSKLHINPKGSAVLSVQIIKFREESDLIQPSPKKQECFFLHTFQKSAIRMMENLHML